MRIVVDATDPVLLPRQQLQRLTDERALGDEAKGMDELDDIGGGHAVS